MWCNAGGGAYQTLLKRVPAPAYPSRPDIAVHAVTIQVPLEGSLLTGGIAFVLKTGQQQWLACRAEGVLRSDFFISTQQVPPKTLDDVAVLKELHSTGLYVRTSGLYVRTTGVYVCMLLNQIVCATFLGKTCQT